MFIANYETHITLFVVVTVSSLFQLPLFSRNYLALDKEIFGKRNLMCKF